MQSDRCSKCRLIPLTLKDSESGTLMTTQTDQKLFVSYEEIMSVHSVVKIGTEVPRLIAIHAGI